MKNRDITIDEINRITEECQPREKAFFTVMRQSGLPPHTMKQLKVGNLERIIQPNTPIPCEISIPHDKSPTFIGEEATKYLKQYLAIRTRAGENLTSQSLLFTAQNNPKKQINTKDESRAFRRVAQKLKKKRKIDYEIRRGKPSELRLTSLTEFYTKNTNDYRKELNNETAPKNDEFCRNLYEKLAMPSLEIKPPAPIEIHQLRKENQELKEQFIKLEHSMGPVTAFYYELSGMIPTTIFPELTIPTENENTTRNDQQLHSATQTTSKSIHDVNDTTKTNHRKQRKTISSQA